MSTESGTKSPLADNTGRQPSAKSPAGDALCAEFPKLGGGVASCACPECGAPMAVRLWLMTADCWRCETSISLAYLWETASASSPAADRIETTPVPAQKRVDPAHRSTTPPGRDVETADPEREKQKSKPSAAERWQKQVPATVLPPRFRARERRNWHHFLRDLSACLLSIIAHLLLLILLALLTFGRGDQPPQIRLSLNVDPVRIEGEIMPEKEAIERVGFKLPVPDPLPPVEPKEPESELWAEEPRVGPREPTPNLPAFVRLKDAVRSDDQYERMLSSRDPRIRREVILQEGGTTFTEAAVARALDWIARHQTPNGSWPLDGFHRAPSCRGRCGDPGRIHSGPGGTALALQAMLGAGQTHLSGMYQPEVAAGLGYLLKIQRPNGDLRGDSSPNAGMYVQALATIALCDALAMTGDEQLRVPAQRAIDFTVAAQHRAGGWRYAPGEAGDTSVVGWQLMAIHSARAAGLMVSDASLVGAHAYLNTAQTDRWGAFYAYRPGGEPTPAMTAEGLLSRMYLGWQKRDPGLRTGVLTLAQEYPPDLRTSNVYYWYYATQVMHHWGGRVWRKWNRQMSDILVTTQVSRGHEAGSWDPNTPHGHQGGRLYMTALACCTLEVYYRHAPLFRKIQLD